MAKSPNSAPSEETPQEMIVRLAAALQSKVQPLMKELSGILVIAYKNCPDGKVLRVTTVFGDPSALKYTAHRWLATEEMIEDARLQRAIDRAQQEEDDSDEA